MWKLFLRSSQWRGRRDDHATLYAGGTTQHESTEHYGYQSSFPSDSALFHPRSKESVVRSGTTQEVGSIWLRWACDYAGQITAPPSLLGIRGDSLLAVLAAASASPSSGALLDPTHA